MSSFFSFTSDFIIAPALLVILLSVGVYMCVKLRFFHLTKVPMIVNNMLSSKGNMTRRSPLKEVSVALAGTLAEGEGQRTVGVGGLDGGDEGDQPLVGEVAVLAPLENKGAESQLVALGAGRENILAFEAVAVTVCVSRADAAVETVVLADVADLDEATDVDRIAVDGLAFLHRQLG